MTRLIAAFAAVLALAACGQPGGQTEAGGETPAVPDPAKGVVNLYTARHYDADLQLYDAFTRATGIKVNRLEMAPDQLIERMKAEGEASPADVVIMADAGALWRAEEAGLLAEASIPELEQAIPAQLRDPEGQWFGFSRRARVIAYDKAKVKPEEVATYEALASPRFKGQVCVRSSDNVYNLSLMAALIERWGPQKAEAWARRVVANMARPPQGGDIDQIRAIGAGACQVALTNSYYYLRIARSEAEADRKLAQAVTLSFPDLEGQGAHVNISGAGIARHAPNRPQAEQFVRFLATPQAQTIFAGANNEFPVAAGVEIPTEVAAFADFKADPMPVVVYGRRQAEAQAIFDRAGWR
ncbi:MAG: extracellular solute-binding protein [Phenylobacterium sp.]|jgi:iron(III) transport system substrate-binding protein|uniref:extracellular solute-binding protein n=1 Tax=Phenylobacterium sp. TaxID=1871053 RepID=UPI002A35C44F|nr:extracellular solute-binding protein [Phenylobacterium sp.]MDX9997708.1 extracellular solute-binding protein [Phenylobacterium sp.]